MLIERSVWHRLEMSWWRGISPDQIHILLDYDISEHLANVIRAFGGEMTRILILTPISGYSHL